MPVSILVLALGVSLYFLVLRTISGFVQDEIGRDLESISHRMYNICNITFDSILQSGRGDDPDTLVIEKALTLGKFEDFFREEGLNGLVYQGRGKELLIKTVLPADPKTIMMSSEQEGALIILEKDAKGYFAYHFVFSPWDWHIIIIKSKKKYADLVIQVKQAHYYTMGLLFLVVLLLVFFIDKTIRRPINAIVKPLQNGNPPEYMGIEVFEFLSCTIKDMMNSLQQSEEKYRSLVETTSDFVWEIDKQGFFRYASPTIKDILGYTPEELWGKHHFDFIPPDKAKHMSDTFRSIADQKLRFERMESVYLHKNGREVVLETSGVPIIDAAGNLVGYRGIDRDITERLRIEEDRKKMEYQLQQLHKLESIGTLAGGIAHDFNNLLAVIMGNITLAQEEMNHDGDSQLYLANAETASLRAQELTSQLITFSKGGDPILGIGAIADLVKETVNQEILGAGVTCKYHVPDNLWLAEFDIRQMKHVLKNMLANAVESMPQGGKITIWADNYEIDPETEKTSIPLGQGKYIRIHIKDDGIGIPPENLVKIFDPYFTTKGMGEQKGMGLGLAVTHSIIARHHGYIAVESKIACGTTFTVYIPTHGTYAQEPKPVEPVKQADGKARPVKILVMDDEEMLRTLAERVLKRIGHESESAKDGAHAVQLYQKALQSGRPFDVVILDLTVKGGMGGKEAIRLLKEIDPNVKAIVSSGYSNDPIMTNYQAYGFCMVLPKPYNTKQLSRAIEVSMQ